MFGDGSGFIHIQPHQTVYVSYSQYFARNTATPSNFILEHGGTLWLSSDSRIIGKNNPAFKFDGHLAGVYNLTLDEGVVVSIGQNATNDFKSTAPSDSVAGKNVLYYYIL